MDIEVHIPSSNLSDSDGQMFITDDM